MSAHLAVPQVTGDPNLPSTLSAAVMTELLRGRLGFDGVSITDALNMEAIPQGTGQVDAVLAALGAGVDLLLTAPDPAARKRIEQGLAEAASGGGLDIVRLGLATDRVRRLIDWRAGFDQPDLGVVGSAEHASLAVELARRSVTLVRDDDGRLPLRLDATARILAVQPIPTDQTPADTTSTVAPGLGAALRRRHLTVDEIVVAHAPSADEIRAVRAAALLSDLVIVGTTAALLEPAQAALVEVLLAAGPPVITVALRTPFDLAAYPASRTHLSTYGILAPSLEALAGALFGDAGFRGRLPAAIPGLYPTDHGLTL
jgi:beta-N-acetylhexosaminidase